jgi:hypothetical protein
MNLSQTLDAHGNSGDAVQRVVAKPAIGREKDGKDASQEEW